MTFSGTITIQPSDEEQEFQVEAHVVKGDMPTVMPYLGHESEYTEDEILLTECTPTPTQKERAAIIEELYSMYENGEFED